MSDESDANDGLVWRGPSHHPAPSTSFSQFDPQYPVPVNAGGAVAGVREVFTIEGPLVTDDDRKGEIATILINVQIRQDATQTVANGQNVMQAAGLTRWSCPVTIESGGFQPGSALGIATIAEQYSDPDEHTLTTGPRT